MPDHRLMNIPDSDLEVGQPYTREQPGHDFHDWVSTTGFPRLSFHDCGFYDSDFPNCSIYDCTFQAALFKYLFSEGVFQNAVSVSCGCNCHLYIFDKQFADPFVISSYPPGPFSTCTVSQSVCCGWHIQESGPAAGHSSLPRHLQMRQLIIPFSKIL